MFSTFSNALTPVLADGPYLYLGGGVGLIIVILVIVLLVRR